MAMSVMSPNRGHYKTVLLSGLLMPKLFTVSIKTSEAVHSRALNQSSESSSAGSPASWWANELMHITHRTQKRTKHVPLHFARRKKICSCSAFSYNPASFLFLFDRLGPIYFHRSVTFIPTLGEKWTIEILLLRCTSSKGPTTLLWSVRNSTQLQG